MNDRSSPPPSATEGDTPAGEPSDPALPPGHRLGAFEIERVLARSASSIVYLATDHALAIRVAVQEYLPARLVRRDAALQQCAAEPWNVDVIERGRRAFIDETRLLACCDHPALVRVTQLFEALGSAFRVMPVCIGPRLSEQRSEQRGVPEEAPVRALLHQLLGAVEAIHRSGQLHGGITPSNILLLDDHRPLLLGAGAANRQIGSRLVDSLMASLQLGEAQQAGAEVASAPLVGTALDLYMLADTLRFWITGEAPAPAGTLRPRVPLAAAIASEFTPEARPHYSAALLDTLDAALSTDAEDRPLTAAQFRDWLVRGVRSGAPQAVPIAAAATPAPSTASPEPLLPNAAPIAAAPASNPNPPFAPGSTPVSELTGDPITPERPPWVAPPLPPELKRVANVAARQRKRSIVAGAVGLALVGLAAMALWWGAVPEIRIEPMAARSGPAPVAAVVPPVPEVAVPVEASAATSTPSPAPPSAESTEPSPAGTAGTADSAPAASVNARGAGQDSSARPVRNSAVDPPREPRTACASRTEFALYRCMVQQCQAPRWFAHAQCVKLRRDDRVD